jgi:hypothetical protein
MVRFEFEGRGAWSSRTRHESTWLSRVEGGAFQVMRRRKMKQLEEPMLDDYEPLRAPRKELVVFEESAHLVPYEEPEKFMRVLVDRVRPRAGD